MIECVSAGVEVLVAVSDEDIIGLEIIRLEEVCKETDEFEVGIVVDGVLNDDLAFVKLKEEEAEVKFSVLN